MLTYRGRGEGAIPRRECRVCPSKGHRELYCSAWEEPADKKEGCSQPPRARGMALAMMQGLVDIKKAPHDFTKKESGGVEFVPGVGFEPT
jgi:hypothetical protein